jgi:hypothetical protein
MQGVAADIGCCTAGAADQRPDDQGPYRAPKNVAANPAALTNG